MGGACGAGTLEDAPEDTPVDAPEDTPVDAPEDAPGDAPEFSAGTAGTVAVDVDVGDVGETGAA